VLRKREDGYHELRTVFHELELHDSLTFTLTKNSGVGFLTNIPELNNRSNLVVRIAEYMQKQYQVRHGVEIVLTKNIPVAAGLGGGSSDAAQTILGLDSLWDLELTPDERHEIAARFGSDINFFLIGGRAIGTGRGEVIEPLPDLEIQNVLLVNPGFAVSSSEAYRLVRTNDPSPDWERYLETNDLDLAMNSLEEGICWNYPEIAEMIDDLRRNGVKTILSGSGPTVIGFCPDADTARTLADEHAQKGAWTCVTRTVNRER
jgi:4-diphosphocytidyl-2-C-methyl-D-erythritol kinase